ncbi:MAG: recombination mediator RecR [bacterium]|nr:recombination mediator RecR [bacterium]
MPGYPKSIERLISELQKFPGIGKRSAERIALDMLKRDAKEALALADAIREARSSVKECGLCHSFSDEDICDICSSGSRDRNILCVVEEPKEVYSIEATSDYNGLYHVLKGKISPLDGIGPEELTVEHLLDRIKKEKFGEIILATNSDIDGEATAVYLAEEIRPLKIRMTRIAFGLPVGGLLDYADKLTISRALEGRREI